MIPDINLLPKIEKGETSLNIAFYVVGIVSLITLGLLIWTFFGAKSDIANATPERDSLLAARDSLQAEVASYDTLSSGSLEESVAFVERVSYPVTPIMVEAQNLLPLNTYLRSYVFSETGVQVVADFETLNAVSSYVSELEKSPYFSDIQVGAISNFEIDPAGEETDEALLFKEVPRYNVEIMLVIDQLYVVAGGDEQ